MSGHGQHDAEDHHSAHDDHHDDETTSDDFPADEPHSPSWLPLLGGALLLVGIFACVMLSSDDKSAATGTDSAPSAQPSANRPTAAVKAMPGIQKMQLPPGHP